MYVIVYPLIRNNLEIKNIKMHRFNTVYSSIIGLILSTYNYIIQMLPDDYMYNQS